MPIVNISNNDNQLKNLSAINWRVSFVDGVNMVMRDREA
jgi:hypothetical protein